MEPVPVPELQVPDSGQKQPLQLHAQVEGEVIQSIPIQLIAENPNDEVLLIEEDNLIKGSDLGPTLIEMPENVENSAKPSLEEEKVEKDEMEKVEKVAVAAPKLETKGDLKVGDDEVKHEEVGEASDMVGVEVEENGVRELKVDDDEDLAEMEIGGHSEEEEEEDECDDNREEVSPVKKEEVVEEERVVQPVRPKSSNDSFFFDYSCGGDDSGTEEEQAAFMTELENFYRERNMEFKPPKFYGEGLNCLKLWRQVTGLGGHEQVTTSKLWRQVGESFRPPKTCTTVSWTFRIFYEKALLEYEKYKVETGEFQAAQASFSDRIADNQMGGSHALSSGRARRDAATRAMQGWHSQRLLGNGEIGDPIIKDKGPFPILKKDRQLKSSGSGKRKKTCILEHDDRMPPTKVDKLQADTMVVDVGTPADWVKINVRKTKDCYEVYALVPGLLREEVQVQSDPAGRLIISGEPEQPDNPWGVTPFKKVINLPSRIDPHQTSAVVTLHGQLFVRVPFEQSKS